MTHPMGEIRSVQEVAGAQTMPTTGRWGWYRDHEGVERRRTSTLIKKVETDRDALDRWFRRAVLIGAARRNDIVLGVKAMKPEGPDGAWTKEQKSELNDLAEKAMEAAKDRDGATVGTAVHKLTERLDRGEALEQLVSGLPATAGTDVRAYEALRRLNGWRSVEIERTVVNDEVEVAGSFDRVDQVPGLASLLGPGTCQYGNECPDVGLPGHAETVIVDVKTEEAPWLNGLHIGPQLAIYSRARKMWRRLAGEHQLVRDGKPQTYPRSGDPIMVPNGDYVPAPCVRQDVAIVVHVRDGQAVPYFVNLAEGWEAALAAKAQMDRESRSKRRLGATGAWFVPVPNVQRPAPAQVLGEHAAAERYADPARPAAGESAFAAAVQPELSGMGSLATALVDAAQAQPVTHEAVRRPDGMVDWVPSGHLDEVDRSAIEAVWVGTDLAALGKVWEIYTQTVGRPWAGRVKEAAEKRRAQIECPQRALHGSDGKCACGWSTGIPA